MKKYAFFLVLPLLATSCKPMWLNTVSPQGPREYKLGWEDGCDSGISAEGGWADKMMYGFKKRPEMAANDQYKQAWNEGFSYCRFSYAASKDGGSFESFGWTGSTEGFGW